MGFPSYFAYISGILEGLGEVCLIVVLFTRGRCMLLAIEMGLWWAERNSRRRNLFLLENMSSS